MLDKKSDDKDDILKCLHSYYLFKHIYIVNLSVYFTIINVKTIDKTYGQLKYNRNGTNSKHIILLNICNSLFTSMFLCNYSHVYFLYMMNNYEKSV